MRVAVSRSQIEQAIDVACCRRIEECMGLTIWHRGEKRLERWESMRGMAWAVLLSLRAQHGSLAAARLAAAQLEAADGSSAHDVTAHPRNPELGS